jgi:hypothetical protein
MAAQFPYRSSALAGEDRSEGVAMMDIMKLRKVSADLDVEEYAGKDFRPGVSFGPGFSQQATPAGYRDRAACGPY